MARVNAYHHALNVGQVDKKHLARIDLTRLRLAAEVQKNIIPLTTGPAFGRPGLEYISTTDSNDVCRTKEFVFGATDALLMEFTDLLFRARVDDVLVTRPSVTASVGTGDFSSDANWTKTATAGATVTISGGFLNLTAAARGSRASAAQTVTVNEAGTEHALRIVIDRGPVILRVGSSSGGDDYINETVLRTGTHSLAFTPSAGSFYIEFFSTATTLKRVAGCTVESSGVMTLPTIWPEASLFLMRFAQSADVVFVACDGYRPQRIERRSNRSWSIVVYRPENGPFTAQRTRGVKLSPSVTEGSGTLTASASFFTSDHVGTLFSLFHGGFTCVTPIAGGGEFTEPFRVTGVNNSPALNDRDFFYAVSGTWAGTISAQRSFDGATSGFSQFGSPISGNVGSTQASDNDSNAVIFYRMGFKEGDYTSGAATITLSYDGGGGSGVGLVTAYNSPTEVDIEILENFVGTTNTSDWRESEWSSTQIWPSAVTLAEGRIWWSGRDRVWGSVSDDYENFDDTVDGDSGPISRSIAVGGVNSTQWMLALQKLLIGTDGAVATCKSSSLDEPITPTNLSIKQSSSTGAAPVEPVKVDSLGLFIDRSGKALMELSYDGTIADYNATQLSKLATDLFSTGVKTMAVQRRPDTRVWVIMDDGSCVCVVYEPLEEVLAFVPIETDGAFESVSVLPGPDQDIVYFVVNRTINGGTVRNIEKMALDSEVKPTTLCKVMDSFRVASPSGTSVTGASHLIGEDVVVWADGAPLTETVDSFEVPLTFTVDGSGEFTLPSSATSIVYGLPYTARYKSARLAYGAQGGTAMLQTKRVTGVGLVLTDFVRDGIRYGSQFDNSDRPLYPLPENAAGTTAPATVLSDINDEQVYSFPGEWDVDSRACVEWQSPFTATVLSLVVSVETSG